MKWMKWVECILHKREDMMPELEDLSVKIHKRTYCSTVHNESLQLLLEQTNGLINYYYRKKKTQEKPATSSEKVKEQEKDYSGLERIGIFAFGSALF